MYMFLTAVVVIGVTKLLELQSYRGYGSYQQKLEVLQGVMGVIDENLHC